MENTQTSRRDFLKAAGFTSLGLAVGISGFTRDASLKKIAPAVLKLEINPFIIIDTTGNITLVNPRPDMGQGSTQAVPSLLAEELEVSLEKVLIVQSDGKGKYGSQTSGGSSSVRELWMPIRKAGAAAREMLTTTAAKRWNLPVSECVAQDGKIWHKASGKSLSYGELADDASKLEIPKEPKLKDPKDFKIIGKYNKRLDVPERVTGKAVYGLDVDVPGMVYAAIVHSPMIHGKVSSIDVAETKKVKGVLQVIKTERTMPHRKSEAVAVVATNWWAALKGKNALKVNWDNGNYAKTVDTAGYFAATYDAAKKEGVNFEEKGDFNAKYATAMEKLESHYETPFLAHAPIEPENAVVHVKDDGSVEIWAPVQGPDWAMRDVCGYLNVKPEQVKINVTLLGGAFGRKAYHDFLLEACHISRELKKPVKVIWTREDDITQGPYRPGMLSHMQGFVESGKITGFHHHAIGESIVGQVFKGLKDDEADPWLSEEISTGNNKYQFGTASKISWTNVKTDIPVVWWRSVYASNFGWGQECFIDELAHLAKKDPLKARLEILPDDRFKKVLDTLAEKANWDEKLPAGTGKGLAVFKSFGSISACCITVSKKDNGVKIDKVVSVIDCGYYVNPDNVKAQTEGNIVMGLTAAIKDGITFTNGICDQTNYHQFNVMRMNETPPMEIHIVDSGAVPGGVGEPGLPPIAPALGNAIFAATGKRLRKLPFDINNIS
ncbi:xanthine dehydrogenase family protein molybdopterin-binding subunit [Dyadobacter fermentans]|uniref:Aldehyde oxidase and xanthine dehydrogenase molybdopterin binding n=1 Tax=Dyadobacter fermentans (strain ATCC 700827 / DSM 18053 / CIP 107007 / KCTC 52180 / NS114) TaxID=471854 RepID=C6VUI2_DYAFD|nr:molybdopterin cofactor-binding domain-containing protein [Dyadobacter fermentans]ACT91291.1 aldehyde oxidase and xanthine dehydrogenase molybdopterin binding [Dyadobacter fermentans DSM 18053]